MSLKGTASPGAGYGFSRPVARVLFHACKPVEYGAFPNIGISGQSDHRLMALRTVAEVRAACGDSDGAAGAYRRYAEAADSVLSAMRDNEVVNLEVMSQIEAADAEFAKQ